MIWVLSGGDHTKACLEAEARRKRAQQRYDERWPRRCNHCLTHTDSEFPCQHCLSNYFTCPRCNRKHAMDEEDALIPCRYCGFDENNPKHKRPADYACRCRVGKDAAQQEELRKLHILRDAAQQQIDRLEARR
jgi:hypothetical protein